MVSTRVYLERLWWFATLRSILARIVAEAFMGIIGVFPAQKTFYCYVCLTRRRMQESKYVAACGHRVCDTCDKVAVSFTRRVQHGYLVCLHPVRDEVGVVTACGEFYDDEVLRHIEGESATNMTTTNKPPGIRSRECWSCHQSIEFGPNEHGAKACDACGIKQCLLHDGGQCHEDSCADHLIREKLETEKGSSVIYRDFIKKEPEYAYGFTTCPECSALYIGSDLTCNDATCSLCGTTFCRLCHVHLADDAAIASHFSLLSTSRCGGLHLYNKPKSRLWALVRYGWWVGMAVYVFQVSLVTLMFLLALNIILATVEALLARLLPSPQPYIINATLVLAVAVAWFFLSSATAYVSAIPTAALVPEHAVYLVDKACVVAFTALVHGIRFACTRLASMAATTVKKDQ